MPANRLYLVEGTPGSGKTTLAMQFLLEGEKNGEAGLYVTLSESKEELLNSAKAHGFEFKTLKFFELPSEEALGADGQNTFFYTSEIELGETNRAILNEVEKVRPRRVVFDSLSELKLLAQDPIKFRRQVLALKQFFTGRKMTVLMLDDMATPLGSQDLHSIVHGVINLEQLSPEYGAERRRLSISKMRGISYRGGYHDFLIRRGGLDVFPRLVAAEHGAESKDENLPSGLSGLDQLLGSGIMRGSSTLLMGPAGAGKSTLAFQFATAAAARGEHVAIFVFDESQKTMIRRCERIGIPAQKYIDSGHLHIKQVDPAELSPGEFVQMVRDCVERSKTRVVVIDSLNGYLHAMPEERFLIVQMHELLSYLAQMGVCSFLVVAQHGFIGRERDSSIELSYLADAVLTLRYFESRGEVRKAISALKNRNGEHEKTIREIKITNQGISVGEPLTDFQGVLTGVPTIVNGNGEAR